MRLCSISHALGAEANDVSEEHALPVLWSTHQVYKHPSLSSAQSRLGMYQSPDPNLQLSSISFGDTIGYQYRVRLYAPSGYSILYKEFLSY